MLFRSRDSSGIEHLLNDVGDSARFQVIDVADDADLDRLVDVAVSDFGGLDYAVSAHTSFECGYLETTREQWRTSLDVNVAGAAMFLTKCATHMRNRGGGACVLVTSISGKVSQPNRLVYPVTKAALLGLNRNLSQALAPDGIRVNSVSPGWTWSRNLERRYGTREYADAFAAEFQLAGRMADPEEIADAICYLCSSGASFITGTDMAVDGGYGALGPEALGQANAKHPPLA